MINYETFGSYISKLSSADPAPGGGSATAMVSTVGAALVAMLAALTVNKKAYLELDDDTKNEFKTNYNYVVNEIDALMSFIDKDMRCYPNFLNAYKLPKDTEKQMEVRNQAIQDATIYACEIPYYIMKESLNVMVAATKLAKHGNKTVMSDLVSGVILLQAAIEACSLNIKMNATNIKDERISKNYLDKMNSILKDAKEIKEDILANY